MGLGLNPGDGIGAHDDAVVEDGWDCEGKVVHASSAARAANERDERALRDVAVAASARSQRMRRAPLLHSAAAPPAAESACVPDAARCG